MNILLRSAATHLRRWSESFVDVWLNNSAERVTECCCCSTTWRQSRRPARQTHIVTVALTDCYLRIWFPHRPGRRSHDITTWHHSQHAVDRSKHGRQAAQHQMWFTVYQPNNVNSLKLEDYHVFPPALICDINPVSMARSRHAHRFVQTLAVLKNFTHVKQELKTRSRQEKAGHFKINRKHMEAAGVVTVSCCVYDIDTSLTRPGCSRIYNLTRAEKKVSSSFFFFNEFKSKVLM